MILAIMVRKLGKVAYSMLIIINSTLNAPVSAIFLAGVMFPWITKKASDYNFNFINKKHRFLTTCLMKK